MAWNDLLVRLRASADADMLRLADLLEMDLCGFSKSGAEGTTHGAKFGDNIPADAQRHFQPEIRRLLDRTPATVEDVVKELASLFGDPARESFKKDCNDGNKCSPSAFRAIRYVTISSFFQYFLKSVPTLPNIGDPGRASTARNHLDKEMRRLEKGSKVNADLARRAWNGRVWVTNSDRACPHEVALDKGLSEADTCSFVVKQMGFLGFGDPAARQVGIGMVALEYLANIEMYRPTVLDALPFLDRAPMVMAFYPGPKGKDHGETLMLDASLTAPGSRVDGGVSEWIHAVESVRLRNIPPADLNELWHCRVAWSGVW
jgi:hypothetical protein